HTKYTHRDTVILGSTNSYYVEKLLGEGGYGVVARCMNVDTEEVVALKMVREYIDKEDAEREVKSLCKLKQLDADTHNVVKFIEHFEYKGRFCLIFELLDLNLVHYMESRDWRPLDVAEIRPIAQQMLVALEGLQNIGLVHADMKLDNIAFVDLSLSQFFKVKLIDFGCAIEVSELSESNTIQMTGYRAPEVIMGLPLTEAVDMWSLGANLAHIFLGEPLYPDESEYEQLRIMVHFQGINDMLHHSKKNMDPAEEADTKAFLSLLKQLLHMDPKKRITPSAALRHRFITMKHLFVNTGFFIRYREQALFLMRRCDLRMTDMDICTSSKVLSSNKASTSDDGAEGSTEASEAFASHDDTEGSTEASEASVSHDDTEGSTEASEASASHDDIEPAKNILDKTNQSMQDDASDIIEVSTKRKHFRRFRRFLSRVIKCFTCCRGVDDD
uniref:Protein kinase domain-containing protein n=1 Tax=Amphiprion ocellaris TaxID=80972 RepID=A0A3Q1BU01_AMPOC